MGKLFGTDGVRGVYGTELTDELARKLGYYGTKVLTAGAHKPTIIIGMDTRESGKPLETALCEGITAAGGSVLLAGVIPTPAVAVLVRELGSDAGIVISASHNPYEYNGIKFFNSEGFKLRDALEDEIEAHIFADHDDIVPQDGLVKAIDNPEKIYLDFIKSEDHESLAGYKIVLDCANGAVSHIAPEYFESLGAELTVLGIEPDGKNINLDCGSTHLHHLCETIVQTGADFGFAFDGDADRCLAADNTGEIIDGDMILNLISEDMHREGTLKGNTVVVTVMSNIGLPLALEENNIDCIRTDVGDRYVLESMQEHAYTLGGEQSGHIIRLDRNTTGDGLLTASMLADILAASSESAHTLAAKMTSYPQVLVNAKVPNDKKNDYLTDEDIAEAIRKTELHFNGKGRVLIRPSGTEPLVRVMIEGEDQAELEQIAGKLASLIEERLN